MTSGVWSARWKNVESTGRLFVASFTRSRASGGKESVGGGGRDVAEP